MTTEKVDSTAVAGLRQIYDMLKNNYNCELFLSCVKPSTFECFKSGGLLKKIPEKNFFQHTHEAFGQGEKIVREHEVKEVVVKEEELEQKTEETDVTSDVTSPV